MGVGPGLARDLALDALSGGCCYAATVEHGERVVRAVRKFGTPLVDLVSPTPYVDHQGGLDDTVLHGWHYYWKATNLTGLSDDLISIVADHAYAARSPRSYSAMFHMGGAFARVPHDATAYAGRDAAHNMSIDGVWLPDESGQLAAAETAWARRFLEALEPHRSGVYVNFLDSDDDAGRVREAYGDQTYRATRRGQGHLRPRQRIPPQQGHQPGRGSSCNRPGRSRRVRPTRRPRIRGRPIGGGRRSVTSTGPPSTAPTNPLT